MFEVFMPFSRLFGSRRVGVLRHVALEAGEESGACRLIFREARIGRRRRRP